MVNMLVCINDNCQRNGICGIREILETKNRYWKKTFLKILISKFQKFWNFGKLFENFDFFKYSCMGQNLI